MANLIEGKTMLLLIVDNSVHIQKVVELAFKGKNFKVITAGDGQEALDKLDDVLPDIIIADSDMPKLNGFELCGKIKNNEKLAKIPVCMLHSEFDEFDEGKFRSCGASARFSKPFKAQDIINKVMEITGASGKMKKNEKSEMDDIDWKYDLPGMEKPSEKSDEWPILPEDKIEKGIQKEKVIEVIPETKIVETKQDKKDFKEQVQKSVKTAMDGSFRNFEKVSQGGWPNSIEGQTMLLLIVDNSVHIQKVVELAFKGKNFKVITAGDGQDALAKLDDVLPDIIIADSDMPKLNGFELCEKIKNNEKLGKIPVCILHGEFDEFDEEKFRSCGASAHFSKPFTAQDIINKVMEITGASGKMKKNEKSEMDDIDWKYDLPGMEKPSEKSDEWPILPEDKIEKGIQKEKVIELMPETKIAETKQDKNDFQEDSSIGKMKKDEETEMDDIDWKYDLPGMEKPSEKSDEWLILPKDKIEKGIQKEKVIELIPEIKIAETKQHKKDFLKDSSINEITEDEIANFMEDITLDHDLKKEPEDFNHTAFNVPEEKDKKKIAEKEKNLFGEPFLDHEEEQNEEHGKKPSVNKRQILEILEFAFDRSVGRHIRHIVERTIKEVVRTEIKCISEKFFEAVARTSQNSPEYIKEVVQDEIKKLKKPSS